MSVPLFDKTLQTLEKSLDLYLVRHTVIADNIANAETPYYKARKVDFEDTLGKAMEAESAGVSEREIASVQPKIYEDPESELGQDLNSVDMDREMAALTKNDLKYSAATTSVNKKFALLKFAISEGTEK
jgi:flagellar basal-body rod protein FlgB